MSRVSELREKAQRHTGNVYDTLFTRRVSIYLTMAAYALGISANAVSAINLAVAAGACALIGLTDAPWLFVGIGLVHLHAVLDSVDGELARLRQKFTIQGLFLEDLCAFTMINGMFLAVGGYLVRTTGQWWPLALGVGVVAFGRNAMQVGRRAILAAIAARRSATVVVDGAPRVVHGLRAFVETTVLHFTNMWVITTTLIVVEYATDARDLVLYAYCFFAAAVLLKEAAVIVTYVFTRALEREVVAIREQARPDDQR